MFLKIDVLPVNTNGQEEYKRNTLILFLPFFLLKIKKLDMKTQKTKKKKLNWRLINFSCRDEHIKLIGEIQKRTGLKKSKIFLIGLKLADKRLKNIDTENL